MASSPPARKFLFDRSFDDDMGFEGPPRMQVTEDQLEAIRKEARQAGYAEGCAATKKTQLEAHQTHLKTTLEHIDRKLGKMLESSAADWERQSRELVSLIARKILPGYIERSGTAEIEDVVTQVLADRAYEPRLVVRIAEAQFDEINNRIKEIADQRAYTGKIVVLGDAALGPSDCRVEWADGGVERDVTALWEQIDKIMGIEGSRLEVQGSSEPESSNLEPRTSTPEPQPPTSGD